ncbi:DUF2064 domain-containing protein [Lishizhenia sp.]|uniref:DUF2064 domain-containing protein n=1 Tax=Lishizhenia sp. TaxID=2497594 RepID=UPI00299D2585|nr:DUF2064 domain-containing protein [Lishizhenia sp.]MDX1446124.1 DUF2064 domain-containing protein [Lishizhenia sp.]
MQKKQFFLHDYSKSKALVRLLNQKIRFEVKHTEFPVFFSGNCKQGSFVQKFKQGFTELFTKGYERVICLGNDVPEINTNLIQEVAGLLDSNDFVSAKTNTGGIAFLGLTKSGFQQFNFHHVQWQSSNLLESLYTEIENQKYCFLQHEFFELNTPSETRLFFRNIKNLSLLTCYGQFFLKLIERQFDNVTRDIETEYEFYLQGEGYRGPPIRFCY